MTLIDDRYELLEVIASGGMATVWRARDRRLDRLVAVKRPHPSPRGDDRTSERMTREARTAAASTHPNLLTIHDHGVDEDGPYLVMELAEGPTLQEAMGSLTAAEALGVGAQIADALAAVHESGVIHRDVKPSNVIMTNRGPLLTDFGIAIDPLATLEITEEGMVVATPVYAAPEVLSGETPSRGSDVYSLAVVIEELLSASGSSVSPELEAVLQGARSSRPESRPTAVDFARALRGLAPTLTLPTPVADVERSDRKPTLLLESPQSDAVNQPSEGRRFPAAPILLWSLVLLLAIALAMALAPTESADVESGVTTTLEEIGDSTTLQPTTSAPALQTTAGAIGDPVADARDRLEAILLEPPRSDLNAREVEKLMNDVDKAIQRAADGDADKAADDLEKVAEEIDEKVDGSNRERALTELQALASALRLELELPEMEDD